jgi:hypothetical protein
VRITAQLIDTETGGHLWGDRYDRDLTDIFEVQDDVTHRIPVADRREEKAPLDGRKRGFSDRKLAWPAFPVH